MRKLDQGDQKNDTLTREQSENIEMAEKGMKSPLNPTGRGSQADQKDEETVVKSATTKPNKSQTGKA